MHFPFCTLATAAVLLGASTAVLAGPVLDRIRQAGKVVVAHREASVPFSYVLKDGQPVGYAVDLCARVVKVLARKLETPGLRTEYVLVNGATRFDTIVEGRADLECETVTNTAERRQRVAFTIPHYVTGARLAVRSDSPMTELKDFHGKRVVSTRGTTPFKTLEQVNRVSNLGVLTGEVAEHALGLAAVESGAADGFLMDEALLNGMIAARPDPSKLKIVGRYVTVEPLAIMFSRDDPELKRLVDDEMRRLILSGEATALHDRWFLQPIPPDARALNLKMPHLLKDFWKYPNDWVPN